MPSKGGVVRAPSYPPSWNMEVMVGTQQPFWITRQAS